RSSRVFIASSDGTSATAKAETSASSIGANASFPFIRISPREAAQPRAKRQRPARWAEPHRAGRGNASETVGNHQLREPRRLPDRAFAKVWHLGSGLCFVAGMHVHDRLPVQQVVDREACLQID